MWLILLAILGVGLWYIATIYIAVDRATVDNGSGTKIDKSEKPFTVLLIGVGGQNHPGGTLADTIMLASVNPKAKSVSLFSIPRDLYVKIPGNGSDKINAAHAFGEKNPPARAPNKAGGPYVLKQAVEDVTGIKVDYFVRIDFDGFKKIVDTLGGVTVNVKTAINDPLYPDANMKGYDPFSIKVGTQTLNGTTALKYARSRETTSDFDRARRQQEILIAIKDKVLSAGVLANPKKMTDLITVLGQHILTDFSPSELDSFITLAKKFDDPTISQFVMSSAEDNLLSSSRSATGSSILIPKAGMYNYDDIHDFVDAYFAKPTLAPESPSITIQNAGAKVSVMADLERNLEAAGFKVTVATATASPAPTTVLTRLSAVDKPASLAYLKDTYKLTATKGADSAVTTDYLLVVGSAFGQTSSPTASPVSFYKEGSSPEFVLSLGRP